eukprot:8462279-Pyramimonas_sp.AAC.1
MAVPALDSCFRLQEGFRLRRPPAFVGSPKETRCAGTLHRLVANSYNDVRIQHRARRQAMGVGHERASAYMHSEGAQTTRLTNLRFADDVLHQAPNLRQFKCILRDFKHEAAKCGLAFHPDKTKIFTNVSRRQGRCITQVAIDDDEVEILSAEESTKYLGRKLTVHDFHQTELANRFAAGRRKSN